MATKTVVELIDDLDGESEAEETVMFAVDGVTYEIDLTGENADALREALAPYTERGRRIGGRLQQNGARPRHTMTRTNLPDVRPAFTTQERLSMQRFARNNGLKPPADRGRIAANISDAWIAAGRPI